MNFVVRYQDKVVSEDIARLSFEVRDRVRVAIEEKLQVAPEVYGKPLRKSLRGYRSLRVSDYRVIFRVEKSIVKIFAIGHRSVIYKMTKGRI